MNVAWFTDTSVTESRVRFGTDGLSQDVAAQSAVVPFFYGSEAGVVRVHRATLEGLHILL